MISHKYKCIFIHISKCAGTFIEKELGVDINNQEESNNRNLFGWNEKHNIYLQHATPQELFDFGFINEMTWNDYFKFIIVRNPWARALSDYIWIAKNKGINDTFSNFIFRKGEFEKIMTIKNKDYRGDHLNKQLEYFHLNGREVIYDKVIRFENLSSELINLKIQFGLEVFSSQNKVNQGKYPYQHYSKFYTSKRKKIVEQVFKDDIKFLNYLLKKLFNY